MSAAASVAPRVPRGVGCRRRRSRRAVTGSTSGRATDSHPAARSPQGAASDHRGGNQPRTLVLLELAGGNDALNMVVPHADPQYRVLRPTLAVADPIDLDGHIGLSPKLTTLADQYRAGRLAIVEGVGVPDPDLSHFASLQRWWTADPDLHAKTGWLGRYLDHAVGYDDPLAGVAIGPGPSPVLAGASSFATSITDAQGLQPARLDTDVRDTLLQAWASLVPSQPPPSLLGQVQRAIHETLDARTRLTDDLGAQTSSASSNASPGDEGTLAGALELAAQLAASKDHPRVIHVHVEGDFDTHEGEAQRHPALMADLDAGVKAFLERARRAPGIRSRGARDDVGVRPARRGERPWHRPRRGGRASRPGRAREGRPARRAAVAHEARLIGEPGLDGRLPRVRRRAARNGSTRRPTSTPCSAPVRARCICSRSRSGTGPERAALTSRP